MNKVTANELTTLLALLEWAGEQKDLLKKLEKTGVYKAATAPPPPKAGIKVKAKAKPKPVKNPLTATTFGKKVRNAIIQAHHAAKQDERIGAGMKIKRWLMSGEFEDEPADTKVLLDDAGALLDSANAADIVGTNLFLGSDDRYYTAHVEVTIDEADEEFVDDVLADTVDTADGGDDEADPEYDTVKIGDGMRTEVTRRDAKIKELSELKADATAAVEGKPLIDVLDTTGEPGMVFADAATKSAPAGGEVPLDSTITNLLDRVEEQAVAGADALEREAKALSEQAATVAGVALERPVGVEELKEAWNEFGNWEPATLRDHQKKLSEKLGHAMGMGEDTQDELAQVTIVVAIHSWLAGEDKKHVVDEPSVGASPAGE